MRTHHQDRETTDESNFKNEESKFILLWTGFIQNRGPLSEKTSVSYSSVVFTQLSRSLAASVSIAVISFSIAVIIVHINIAAPAIAVIANRIYVCCCMKIYCVFAMNYSCAPTLRSNATTSGLFLSMAHLRGVLLSLQAGGWVAIMRITQHKLSSKFKI